MNDTKICAAFVKAQSQFKSAIKTSTNPHFKSRYADLSSCIDAVIDALNLNGIALMHVTHDVETGVCVETMFIHESGERLTSGKMYVPTVKNDAQAYGSAITYARRYSLMAACGISPEDDDGNAATKGAPVKEPAAKSVKKASNELTGPLFGEVLTLIDHADNMEQIKTVYLTKVKNAGFDKESEQVLIDKCRQRQEELAKKVNLIGDVVNA